MGRLWDDQKKSSQRDPLSGLPWRGPPVGNNARARLARWTVPPQTGSS